MNIKRKNVEVGNEVSFHFSIFISKVKSVYNFLFLKEYTHLFINPIEKENDSSSFY